MVSSQNSHDKLWFTCFATLHSLCMISTANAQVVSVTFSAEIHSESYTGPVYLFFSENNPTPRMGPNWFRPEPFLRMEVSDWQPNSELVIDVQSPKVVTFPKSFQELKLNGYHVQAITRFNPWERDVGQGAGNGMSLSAVIDSTQPTKLEINRLVSEQRFRETAERQQFEVRSKLMSEFYQREVSIKAGILLPKSYGTDPNRRYPVIYEVPGFGGDHHHIERRTNAEKNTLGVEFIRVMLNPDCPLGHHVFANSANNGPWNDALIQEFLTAFDNTFRTVAEPRGRFLTGHSSGGWSSLWIMVTNPNMFAGTWSTAPDPVDFRDFQRINLYDKAENMFVDQDGRSRPLARSNGEVIVEYKQFSDMEHVLGPGGQLHSFEAVFSPKGADGRPLELWNRESGKINTAVATTWKPYDIRLLLEENWDTLGPQLEGKIHVYMGTEDTFYLEGATQLLKESLQATKATIEMIPGRDHMNLFQDGLHQRIEQDMAETFLR